MSRRPTSRHVLAVARGDAPADLLVTGGMVLSPATREWVRTDLAIADGVVAGWGHREAKAVVDVGGAALTPGFIDAHMHLESTKVWVDEFVRAVLPRGTTAVAADPHEIANVFGTRGVMALVEAARALPFTFGVEASSCVPASAFESSGAELTTADVSELLRSGAIGVAEVMNYPGVIQGDLELLAKIEVAGRLRVDGHAPGLSGAPLDAYLAAGVESDHECTELAEAEEKRRKGMWIFIRQGSASQNLAALAPTVLLHGTDLVALCTDDREPATLLGPGHMNDCVRLAVEAGISEVDALVMATSNPAAYHGFSHLGSLGPGYQADICCFDRLSSFEPAMVWQNGELVAIDGVMAGPPGPSSAPHFMYGSVHLGPAPVTPSDLDLRITGPVKVISVESRTLTTRTTEVDLPALVTGAPRKAAGVSRLAVVERHRGTGRIGLGYASGFGLERGAIASTVAHDAHNCVLLGAMDGGPDDMAVALRRLAEIGGGQVAVLGGEVLAEVALPVGGLMSDRPVGEVAGCCEHLDAVASGVLGVTIESPFMQLSFISLSVLPELRLCDRGLVDVVGFAITGVAAGSGP